MSKYQISIQQNKTKDIVVENYKSKPEEGSATFFHTEYAKADSILLKITQLDPPEIRVKPGEQESDFARRQPKVRGNLFDVRNNIIIFTGDRGSGKTSAMVSFGKYLEEKPKTENKYKLLDIVDPSYFKNNESILLNVVTIMFRMAKKRNEELRKDASLEQHNPGFTDLLRKFDKVFTAVKKMDEIIPQENSLEYLNELSGSTDLNPSIRDLVKSFLKFFEGGHDYLVLMIDDLDMNVSYAATMLEQIRKFLIQDNIIILFATNIDQLQFEMKEYYSKYYVKINESSQQSTSINVDVEDMATKYLLKLFPPLQRIHISDAASKLIETDLSILSGINDKIEIKGNLQRVVLNLIWMKTRLIFIPEEYQLHPIIPTNLRALNQFIQVLIDMDDILVEFTSQDTSKSGQEYPKFFINNTEFEKARNNFYKFKDYIMNIWIPTNVSFEEKKVFDNIPKDIKRINKHLIQSINVIGQKYKKLLLLKEIESNLDRAESGDKNKEVRDIYTFVSRNDPRFDIANKISDIFNYPSNNTAGDILLLIDKYNTYFEAANQTKFIEAVKIFYSMLLFETMFFVEQVKQAQKDQSKQVKEISRIQALIGGTLFFPHYFTIIKSSAYDRLKNAPSEPDHLYYNLYSKSKIDKFGFLFFILYYGEKRPDRSYDKHIYDTKERDLEDTEQNKFRFDILSLLVNSLNPLQTVARSDYKYNLNDKKIKNIINWRNNHLNDDDPLCRIQNFILPIYSVDLMLGYLREPEEATEIGITETKDRKKMESQVRTEAVIINYYDALNKRMLRALNKISNEKDALDPDKSDTPISTISKLYNKIYMDGKSCFIDNIFK
ncbi:MAG: hypothetical protein NT040_19710 [Bacteroidetes bacterium]|nr:hypothetical protein [Bacteroidota bacterium]